MKRIVEIVRLKGLIMRTKEILSNTFYQLLKTTSIENITVERILRESGVSKSTFYRHFKDKYDLMNYYFCSYIESLEYDSSCDSWQVLIERILLFMQEHKEYFKSIQRTDGQNSFDEFLQDFTFRFNKEAYLKNTGKQLLSFEEHAALIFISAGANAIMNDWFRRGLTESAADVANVIYANIPETVRSQFF